MNVGNLHFHPITDSESLLSQPTKSYLQTLTKDEQSEVGVTEIDPRYMGGLELCEHYGIDQSLGGNCIIIKAKRAGEEWYAACLVPPGARIDLNGLVRKHLNARQVSLAPKAEAVDLSCMEYGSINIVGLPDEWPKLIDSALANKSFVVMGSGLSQSKIAVPSSILRGLPNSAIVEGLGTSN